MAIMAGDHGAAARLRHVADQKTVQPIFFSIVAETLEEADEMLITPIAIERQPHHLPGGARDRQRHCTAKAAVGVRTD